MKMRFFLFLSLFFHSFFFFLPPKKEGHVFSKHTPRALPPITFEVIFSTPQKVASIKSIKKNKGVTKKRVVKTAKSIKKSAITPSVESREFGTTLSFLAEEPKLLSFFAPEYTEEALEAELSGLFRVKVFVSKEGKPLDIKLEDPIGYGMDEKVLEAAREALFLPSKNKNGETIEAWAEVHVQLEMF